MLTRLVRSSSVSSQVLGAAVVVLSGTVASAYVAPVGFQTTGQKFAGSAVAVAPDGKVAVATDNTSGGASVSVYASLAAVGTAPLQTFTDATWTAIGGLDFADNDTLVIGENGPTDTAYKASVSAGTVASLAPAGSVPNIGDVYVHAGLVYLPAANGPAHNDLFSVPLSGAAAPTLLVHNYGAGYGGGVAVDSVGRLLLTDSNGFLLRYGATLSLIDSISLGAGGGWGAVDVALDSDGDAFVSTGDSLTRVHFAGGAPTVSPFGAFAPGSFSFPTLLAFAGGGFEPYAGAGQLLVSGFTDEYIGGVFVVTPAVPEPATVSLLAVGSLALVAGPPP